MTLSEEGVSVILCCFNSSERLPETLKHLSEQVTQDFQWEIVLVNNASTDNTVDCAIKIWKKIGPQFVKLRIVEEPVPGQAIARKKGVVEAKFNCIIFCDDDNWLDKNYVSIAMKTMDMNRAIGAMGGRNFPVSNIEKYPDWFEEYKDKYATGIPADRSGNVSSRGFILGAGMVTRRGLFLDAYSETYPSLLKGRSGGKLSTGDDFEYCKRLLLWNYQLYYQEDLLLNHFIPLERLTLSYREKLMNGIDEAGKVLSEYDLAIHVKKRFERKNRWRLLGILPFRILFAKLGWTKRNAKDEALTFYYLSPFWMGSNPQRTVIKKIINHNIKTV